MNPSIGSIGPGRCCHHPKQSTLLLFLLSLFLFLNSSISQPVHTEDEHAIWNLASPNIEVYSERDYQGWKQIWAITQGHNDHIYAANGAGLLEYDGVEWRNIPLSITTVVRDVACADDGTIYVAAANEFGFLAPDSVGSLQFTSLKPYLDSSYHDFGTMWHVYPIDDAIYFVCGKYLLRWQQDQFRIWRPRGSIGFGFCVDDQIYFEDRGIGITRLEGDSLRLIEDPGLPTRGTVFMAEAEGGFIIGHQLNGFSKYDGTTRPLLNKATDETLRHGRLYGGMKLSNGDYLAYSLGQGVMIFSGDGKISKTFDKNDGLPSNVIYNAFEDRMGSIWLSTDKGISRIDLSTPVRILDQRHGIPESVHSMISYRGNLFLGLNVGLYELADQTFEKIEGTRSTIRAMHILNGDLIINHFDSILWIDQEDRVKKVRFGKGTYRDLIPMPGDSSMFIVYDREGMIYAFSKTGGMWRKTGPDLQTPDYILQFMEGPDHSLWVMTPTQGILVYDDVKSFFRGEVDTCSFIGIPVRDSYSSMVMSGNTVYLHYQHKVYRWDEKVDSFVFITGVDLISGTSSIGSTGRRIFVNTLSQGVYDLYFLEDDILRQDHWKGIFPSFQILEVFESKDMVVAFGPDGVLLWKKWSTWNSLVSEVTIRRADFNDKMRFGGYGDISISDLPHKKNKVHFRYALPYYINVGHHSYRYKLESYQDEWSSWNQQNHVTFTNLPPGEYIFSVEGRNLLGAISPPAELAFSIAAPWHQSWWAYGFYLLAGFLGMAAIVRFRSRQLRKEKLALQKLVMARTAELQVRNELLNEQTQQLAKHTEELKKVDKLKSRLFANISHEFRTPLTLLKGPLDRLKRFPESGLQKKDLEMMRRNTDRLLRLVNQLLDLSKVDAGTLPVNLTEGNLYKFLRALTSSFSSHAASRNIDYQIQIPPGKSWAAFDRDKLEKIVLNLLSNAFKFTGDDGWIRFEAIQQKDLLELSVADNGVGIPASELDSIFDRFYQVDDSDRKIDEGTGIGLALVKELVNLLNGRITVDSTLGEGTTFFAQLPIQEIQSPKSSDERLIETILEKMPRVELSKQKHIHANAEAKLVLVVEDNADMRNYVAEQLGDSYKVELAGSGQEGLLVAQESIPDLVVTDLMMPEMDGLELCKLLKSDERTSHIPVLVLTAKAGMNSKLEGLETGADVYLTKPFDARELKAQVQNLIRQREKLREIFATSDPFAPQDIHWTSLDQQFLQKLLDLLERKYQDPKFGSQELQKTLNLSKTVLYRKIKALTGQSPTEFLRNFRLKRAAQILLNNGETVSQTAFSVGFNNLSYFAKCFKELHGVSPSAYARKVQLSQDRDS